jgi:hypothetical protein
MIYQRYHRRVLREPPTGATNAAQTSSGTAGEPATKCQNRRRHLSHRRSLEAQKTGPLQLQLQQRVVLKKFYQDKLSAAYQCFLCRRLNFLSYKFLRVALAAVAVDAPRAVDHIAARGGCSPRLPAAEDGAIPPQRSACLQARYDGCPALPAAATCGQWRPLGRPA